LPTERSPECEPVSWPLRLGRRETEFQGAETGGPKARIAVHRDEDGRKYVG
jgi:hypothetical protein